MLKVLLWTVFIFSALGSFYDWISSAGNSVGLIYGISHFGTGISATVALAGLAIIQAIDQLRPEAANAAKGIPDEI
jgi:hypothetical protein